MIIQILIIFLKRYFHSFLIIQLLTKKTIKINIIIKSSLKVSLNLSNSDEFQLHLLISMKKNSFKNQKKNKKHNKFRV